MRHSIHTITILIAFATIASNAICQTPALAPVFGENGVLQVPIGNGLSPGLKTHAIQPDGKVLCGGFSYSQSLNTFFLDMIRFDPICGALDSGFANNGHLQHRFETGTKCHSMALQTDGKIVGVGEVLLGGQPSSAVFRFNADGSVDDTFNSTGYKKVELGIPGQWGTFHELIIDDLGRMNVAIHASGPRLGVVRLLSNGDLDPTYGVNGMAIQQHAYSPNWDNCAAVLHPGGAVTMSAMVGTGPFNPHYLALRRFDANGEADATFGVNGFAAFPTHIMDQTVHGFKGMDMAVLSDGRMVVSYGSSVAGNSNQRLAVVAAFLPDGTIDPAFGINGRFEYGPSGLVSGGLHVLPDDKILLFHAVESNNGPPSVLRITATGQLDATFGNGGVLNAPLGSQPDYRVFVDGTVLDDGSILGYGRRSNTDLIAMRLGIDPIADALPQITLEFPQLTTTGSGTFQWFLDGVEIDGATGDAIVPAENGVYTVEMSLAECTYLSPPYTLETVGLDEHRSSAIRVLQNPVEELLVIDNNGPSSHWSLTDLRGAQVANGSLTSGRNELPLHGVRTGVYLLHIVDLPGVYRVVKQ